MADLPIVITPAGQQPQTAVALRTQVVAYAQEASPGYTDVLPGSLVEDLASTAVGALLVCDSALVDLINSVNPRTANQAALFQLGAIYGIEQGSTTNTSVYVVLSGPAGTVIPRGFTVTDGTYQYVIQNGGIISSSGSTPLLYAVATVAGSWSVPAGSVNALVTSAPPGVTLTVTNPQPGTPQEATETEGDYRGQVLQAGLASAQGMPRFLKTLLNQVAGVQSRLVSVLQATSSTWEIIVGGGDPYEVAYAIYSALFDINVLTGSSTSSRNVSVQINDYPDSYNVVFVNPPQQTVGISLTWNTSLPNFVSSAAVAQLGTPALVNYINSIPVGAPINLFELQAAFQQAVSSIVPTALLTRMLFNVTINGTTVAPQSGTGLIEGDPESYFLTSAANVTVTQG